MTSTAAHITYNATNSFGKIVIDYIEQKGALTPLYNRFPSLENIKAQIADKKQTKIERTILYKVLSDQYSALTTTQSVTDHIAALQNENTFTICTAHQPNIFTGHLYFVYKILHTIKICNWLKSEMPDYKFVPVYYMGSEDADLEELGHINIEDEQLNWNTNQKGAVGRMIIDDELLKLVERLKKQFTVEAHGAFVINIVTQCYRKGISIQQATLEFTNALFGAHGLLVLIADHKLLKQQMINVFKNEITNEASSKAVIAASGILKTHYKEQAYSRAINLFYLQNDIRSRIEQIGEIYEVHNTNITFTKDALLQEIQNHPERFSPNVILRGLFQETIMPNIAFVGGGGELAYWLQLKQLFVNNNVPFPILVLRNSFLITTSSQIKTWQKIGYGISDLFAKLNDLETKYVSDKSENQLNTESTQQAITTLYAQLKLKAAQIDTTLEKHIAALLQKQINKLEQVDKKLLRTEKRNFDTQLNQIRKIKNSLFPKGNLQERNDNIIPFLSKFGMPLIDELLQHSLTIEHQFTVLTIAE